MTRSRPHTTAILALLGALACGDSTPSEPGGPPAIASVSVTPGSVTLASLGETRELTAAATRADGTPVPDGEASFDWTSSDPSVATVGGSGTVTAMGNGNSTITATVAGGTVSGQAAVTVEQEAASITLSLSRDTLEAGDTATAAVTVTDAGGSPIEDPRLAWSSSDEGVATVDAAGLVTAVDHGETVIRAVQDGAAGTVQATVVRIPFSATSDTTVSGSMRISELTVADGVTVTAAGDVVVDATGAISVAGALVADCGEIRMRSRVQITVGGRVANSCSGSQEPGGLSLHATGGISVEGGLLESHGEIVLEVDTARVVETSSSPSRVQDGPTVEGVRVVDGEVKIHAPTPISPADARPGKRIRVVARDVFLDGATLRAQDGAPGADSTDSSADFALAEARDGADGGWIQLTLTGGGTFHAENSSIRAGDGGPGGKARAEGLPGAPDGGSARAVGGAGGWGGSVSVEWTGDLGTITVSSLTLRPGDGGPGGDAVATGADGADATEESAAGRGGEAFAQAGPGGPPGVTQGLSDEVAAAGDGGAALATGGKGGDGSRTFPDGAPGGFVTSTGGAGGGVNMLDPEESNLAEFGDGGSAVGDGGDGGHGAGLCVAAQETELEGEIAVESDPAGSDRFIFSAGTVGISLSWILREVADGENQPGGKGGDGGDVTVAGGVHSPFAESIEGVVREFRDGDALAGPGGNGGNGGDGDGPGAGGSGGALTLGPGEISTFEPLGEDGQAGSPCSAGVPGRAAVRLGALQADGARTVVLTSPDQDWVTVEGTLSADGTLEASGRGTVAGFPDILAEFSGTWDAESATLTGSYTLDSENVIDPDHPVVYSVTASGS